ncbi:MAG TPA: PH domain-containing protein [Pyrinomonadaceae bacterium]|nr:PH domain-containing protein [Pyrinomonadaceae bacterium]
MSYVQSVLQPGEHVRHTAKLHWIMYWPGLAFVLTALAAFVFAERQDRTSALLIYLAGVLAIVGLIFLLREWFVQWTTEIAVTDRRVIYKTGFISRRTNEMHIDKVESVQVDQPVLGRILDYGHVTFLGTGEGFETLRRVAAPIELRNHVTGV